MHVVMKTKSCNIMLWPARKVGRYRFVYHSLYASHHIIKTYNVDI